MKEFNCLVVDDEPIARSILENYMERLPGLILVKSCRNATEAYEALYEHSVDLMFLDIQMPVVSGTEFLRSLPKPPAVVFTTAYPNYAVEGFELNSVDYLLKPIVFERFCQAIQKVREKLSRPSSPTTDTSSVPDYIFIKQDTKLKRVNFADIAYVQAERDFCSVYLDGGVRLLVGMHLKRLEALLPPTRFVRTHRSYIVNVDKIKAIMGNTLDVGKIEIPVGANYRDSLFGKINLLQ